MDPTTMAQHDPRRRHRDADGGAGDRSHGSADGRRRAVRDQRSIDASRSDWRGLFWLWRASLRGRLNRGKQRLMAPRRLVMSIIACLLAAVWLGNTILAAFLRQPAGGARVAEFFSGGLVLYLAWHLIRIAWNRPTRPIEWSEAEEQWLLTAPVPRHHLLLYRIGITTSAAAAKACLVAIVLLPDLPYPLLGYIALLGGLMSLELVRMLCDQSAAGCKASLYRILRYGLTSIAIGAAITIAVTGSRGWHVDASGPARLLRMLTEGLAGVSQTVPGQMLLAFFHPWGQMATASSLSLSTLGWSIVGLLQVAALASLLLFVDAMFQRRRSIVSRREARGAMKPSEVTRTRLEQLDRLARRAPAWPLQHLHGLRRYGLGQNAWTVATLAWRQAIAVRRTWTTTLVSLSIPAILSGLPLVMMPIGPAVLPNIVGNLVFFTLVLGPAAVKADFRRDLDRIAVLKGMPIHPVTLVFGQLAVPVLTVTILQLPVLLAAWCHGAASPAGIVASLLVLIPANILVFAFENTSFLCFPYRMHQEGLEVLVRSTLSFTAKGAAFALAIVLVWLWAQLTGSLHGSRTLFLGGLCAGLWVATAALLWSCSAALRRFDPARDLPA
jgi:hypothetical protein